MTLAAGLDTKPRPKKYLTREAGSRQQRQQLFGNLVAPGTQCTLWADVVGHWTTIAVSMQSGASSTILDEKYDPNYEPSQREIREYAKFLGMDLERDLDLLWIAREGLKVQLPPNWKPCKTEQGEYYYFNFATGESVWNHPCDNHYREVYKKEARKRARARQDEVPRPKSSETVTPVRGRPLARQRRPLATNPTTTGAASAARRGLPSRGDTKSSKTGRPATRRTGRSVPRRSTREKKMARAPSDPVRIVTAEHKKKAQSLRARQATDLGALRKEGERVLRMRREQNAKRLMQEEALHNADLKKLKERHDQALRQLREQFEAENAERLRPEQSAAAQKLQLLREAVAKSESKLEARRKELARVEAEVAEGLARAKADSERAATASREIEQTAEALKAAQDAFAEWKARAAVERATAERASAARVEAGELEVWQAKLEAQLQGLFAFACGLDGDVNASTASRDDLVQYFTLYHGDSAKGTDEVKRILPLIGGPEGSATTERVWVQARYRLLFPRDGPTVADLKAASEQLTRENKRMCDAVGAFVTGLAQDASLRARELEETTAKLEASERELEERRRELDRVAADLDNKVKARDAAVGLASKVEASVIESKRRLNTDSKRLEELQNQISAAQQQLGVAQREARERDLAEAGLRAQVAAAEERAAQSESEARELSQVRDTLSARVNELKGALERGQGVAAELRAAKTRAAQSEENARDLEKVRDALSARITELESAIKTERDARIRTEEQQRADLEQALERGKNAAAALQAADARAVSKRKAALQLLENQLKTKYQEEAEALREESAEREEILRGEIRIQQSRSSALSMRVQELESRVSELSQDAGAPGDEFAQLREAYLALEVKSRELEAGLRERDARAAEQERARAAAMEAKERESDEVRAQMAERDRELNALAERARKAEEELETQRGEYAKQIEASQNRYREEADSIKNRYENKVGELQTQLAAIKAASDAPQQQGTEVLSRGLPARGTASGPTLGDFAALLPAQKRLIRGLQQQLQEEQSVWRRTKTEQLGMAQSDPESKERYVSALRAQKVALDDFARRLNEDVRALKYQSKWIEATASEFKSLEAGRDSILSGQVLAESLRMVRILQGMLRRWEGEQSASGQLAEPLARQNSLLRDYLGRWGAGSGRDGAEAREVVIRLKLDQEGRVQYSS